MTDQEQRAAAKEFAKKWRGRGDEKSDTQTFWLSLLRDVYGVERPEETIEFERRVKIGHVSFIDAYIPSSEVLIEQKSIDVNLASSKEQSSGDELTPYEQAKRYADNMSYDDKTRWIVTCNFRSFNIHDMKRPHDPPATVLLENLEKEYYRLQFLVDRTNERYKREMEVSIKAGELVGVLYDLLIKQYKNPDDPFSLRSLNMLCVRLVFCLYAEDAGVFGKRNMFHDYMKQFDAKGFRRGIIDLFQVLDQRPEERDPYLPDDLAAFPYVNGGLFANENIEIPQFTEEIRAVLLAKASDDFDWSEISPTIFGAVFESTLNPETRRSGGMHYTSIENIHKVIDPLFLDELNAELDAIRAVQVVNTRIERAQAFQAKLAKLKFLDPACGSGNFLTETYLSLRRLENEAIKIIYRGRGVFGNVMKPIQVSIEQFYGVEINDFAVTVARTALWIAESQMLQETLKIAHFENDFLPLKTIAVIVERNALTIDWNDVCPKEELTYIMGNPPFVGYSNQTEAQKLETRTIFSDENGKEYKNAGKIDYVANWYFKACQYMQGSTIRAAFVSTNSVTQGDQVAAIWKPLYERFGVDIIFAYRTFRWDSEANIKAHVHCVIIGFTVSPSLRNVVKRLYHSDSQQIARNINPYLIDAPNILIENRKKSICDVPQMSWGSKPTEGGFLFLNEEERAVAIKREPQIELYIRRAVGAEEYINRKIRYCLWLVGVSPHIIKGSSLISERVASVKDYRSRSAKASTRKDAGTPWLFQENHQPTSNYIIIPRVSSEKRNYIPLGFMTPDVIVTDSALAVANATLYHFGILTSSVHMAWTRAVCGRLKSDYRYSKDIVYNNFVWPESTAEQKTAIEQTAQGILDARALFPDSSLADLYDETTMPPELRKAHEANDKAVLKAYGFSTKASEEEIVAALMKLYSAAVNQ
ncbi:MAG: class I SAM-dependent DNA methyltransferase [Thermoguttaceae bacterium]|nr:class I SAM-dependent DNA methyltransferase [Thermoguttaceae bacterium]